MAVSLPSPSSLDLTLSTPGFSTSPSLPSSGDQGGYAVRVLDINQIPSVAEEYSISIVGEDDEENANGTPPRKKLRLSKEQSCLLEESFRQHHTLNPRQKEALALQLKLKPRQVEVWFQNRRARSKLKQTEMECECLKRWFGSLTEQNRRLQREVEELRAMKVGPPIVLSPHTCQPLPASVITMCPRCECVTTTSADRRDPTTTSVATAVNLSSKAGAPTLLPQQPSAAC
ncbi:hypothetical protein K2173_002207 [Erythroxylum novogranatense]|uniref:Homeobox domain-containing protein n=1 Tax=Erythroxylum novogranatense TaxID=1862640 RepID=A0AAV8TQV3_9ROSI|nr:hypothetical protein K2173_002207 [Erythroxylum novogranatense]